MTIQKENFPFAAIFLDKSEQNTIQYVENQKFFSEAVAQVAEELKIFENLAADS